MDKQELPSELYSRLKTNRTQYEDRAKLISRLTLPYIMREDSDSGTTAMVDTVNQSYGGRLINTLKAKMGMALMPPSVSSFKYVAKPEELAELTGGNKDNIAKVYQVMSNNISVVNAEIELQQIRTSLFDLITQLLIVGSVVVEKKKGKGITLHTLQSFVADLDEAGNPVSLCFIEKLKIFPKDIIPKEDRDEYELFTMAKLDKESKKWIVTQEIEQELVGKEQSYKDYDALPFRYLGWTWMTGDAYHRPYAEDYFQDLNQLDKLAKLLTDGAIIQAKVLLFVNPKGGRTTKKSVSDTMSGDIVDGVADDVTSLEIGKNFDFQVPMQREQNLQKTLAQAFLMNESVTREAERVTAQEIQFMAQELESSSLAGMYSKLSLQWSKWIVNQIMAELGIKFESIEVEILTGLDALGRGQEAKKLDAFVQRMVGLEMKHWLHEDELANRYASFENVNSTNLLKTPAEVEKMIKAQQAQQAMQMGDESMASQAGQNVANTMVNPQQQQGQ